MKHYAKYILKHMKIVKKIKERHKCWLVALRYHLAIRMEIFRENLDKKGKKKKHSKGKKSLPKGRKKRVEGEARWDTEAAVELKYYETNPYAPGNAKAGVDFFTGRNKYESETSPNEEGRYHNPQRGRSRNKFQADRQHRPPRRSRGRFSRGYFRGGSNHYYGHIPNGGHTWTNPVANVGQQPEPQLQAVAVAAVQSGGQKQYAPAQRGSYQQNK